MTYPTWRPPLALIIALCSLPTLAIAQQDQSNTTSDQSTSAQPAIFSFILRQAGSELLSPFGVSGRREVLQLRAGHSPLRGEFRRARLDRLGQDDWTTEGWYEIRGATIQLYHSDAGGSATGRVEIGRYLENTICLSDPENGQLLAFSYLKPSTTTTATPNAAQGNDFTEGYAVEDNGTEGPMPLDRCGGGQASDLP